MPEEQERADSTPPSDSSVTRRTFLLGGGAIVASGAIAAGLVYEGTQTTAGKTPTNTRGNAKATSSTGPAATVRWKLRDSAEGWRAGASFPHSVVAHDLSGWLRASGSGGVSAASFATTGLATQDWRLPDDPHPDRLTVTARVQSSAPYAELLIAMTWLSDDGTKQVTAQSAKFLIPSNRDVDVDTWWDCRGTAPTDVLVRVIGVEVQATASGELQLYLRDVRQPPPTTPYGPMPSGVGEMFFASAPAHLAKPVPADGYAVRVLSHLDVISDWSRENSRAIHIGEWAWPKQVETEGADATASQAAWTDLAVQWMRKSNLLAIPFTPWGETAYWSGVQTSTMTNYGSYPDASYFCGEDNFDLNGDLPRVVSAIKPAAKPLVDQMGAVPGIPPSINIVGGCFVYLRDGTEFSSTNIGVRGTDYFMENPATIDFLYRQGWRIFRVPFRWDRVMRTPDATSLDASEWGYVKNCIEHILSLPDAAVIVDQHSSAQFWISPDPDNKSTPAQIYTVDAPDGKIQIADYVRFWTLVSDSLRPYSDRLIYEITNEPHGDGANPFSVKRYTQAVIEALRSRGDLTFCLIPSFPYDNVIQAIEESNQPFPWIRDPAGTRHHAYTFHAYMDSEMSGGYKLSYEAELAKVD